MRRFYSIIVLLVGLLVVPTLSFSLPYRRSCKNARFDPYADPRWGGGVEIIGEYLYLGPSLSGLEFLVSDPRPLFLEPRLFTVRQYEAAVLKYTADKAKYDKDIEDWRKTRKGDKPELPVAPKPLPKLDPANDFTLTSLPKGIRQGIDPERRSGFRIGVARVPPHGCRDVTLAYAGFFAREKTSFFAPQDNRDVFDTLGNKTTVYGGIWPVFGVPNLMQSRLNPLAEITGAERKALWAARPVMHRIGGKMLKRLMGGSAKEKMSQPPKELTAIGVEVQGRGEARAFVKAETSFSCIDGQFGFREIWGCDLWVRGHLGLRGVMLAAKQRAQFYGFAALPGDTADPAFYQFQQHLVQATSRSWGVGPRAGFDVRYDVSQGLGVGAHFGLAMLGAARTGHWSQSSLGAPAAANLPAPPDFSIQVAGNDRRCCGVVPEIDGRLGINYLQCSGGRYFVMIEIGYEFTAYVNALLNPGFDSFDRRSTTRNLSFSGIYVSARVRF